MLVAMVNYKNHSAEHVQLTSAFLKGVECYLFSRDVYSNICTI